MAFNKRDEGKLCDAWRYAQRVDTDYSWEFMCACLTDLKNGIQGGKNEGTQEDINNLHTLWLVAWYRLKEA